MLVYTPPKAAKFTGLSVRTLRKYWKELGGKKIGNRVYYSEDSLKGLVRESRP